MTVVATLLTAVLTFTVTNIDDIFVLMMFFSQTDSSFRRRHVVVGQYLGFVALVTISLLGFWGSLIIPKEFIGFLGLLPIAIGIRKLVRNEDDIEVPTTALPNPKVPSIVGVLLHPKTYSVAVVTFANGGDNIGIYTPLFASLDTSNLIVTVVVFLLLVMLWCVLGIRLAGQRHIAQILTRYGHMILPLVLIGLGVFIIIENGTLHLFGF